MEGQSFCATPTRSAPVVNALLLARSMHETARSSTAAFLRLVLKTMHCPAQSFQHRTLWHGWSLPGKVLPQSSTVCLDQTSAAQVQSYAQRKTHSFVCSATWKTNSRQAFRAPTPQTRRHGETFYATCHPGLEDVVAEELQAPEIGAVSVEPGRSGVTFRQVKCCLIHVATLSKLRV